METGEAPSWLCTLLSLEGDIFRAGSLLFREAPLKNMQPLFGHCPNSDSTPPLALKRALWGTFFPGRFEQICQITVLTQSILASLNTLLNTSKCPF